LLSICIPAYTYVDYTAEAISALLSESEDFEVIVVEDFDLVDANAEMHRRIAHVRELLNSDQRVVWQRNREIRTIQDNWNFTVALATRPYVKLMGADDRLRPGGVARIQTMIRQAPEAQFHGHLARIIDDMGRVTRLQRPYIRSRNFLATRGAEALQLKLRQIARFKEPACNVFTKAVWQQVGGYSKRFRFCFDIDFNIRVMRENACYLWNEYVVDLRRHAGSDGAKLPSDLAAGELRQLIDEVYEYIGDRLTPQDKASGEAWFTYRLIELGLARYRARPRECIDFLVRNRGSIEFSPSSMVRVVRTVMRRAWFRDVQCTLP